MYFFRISFLTLAVKTHPININSRPPLEQLREVEVKMFLNKYNLDSIDKLSMKHFTDDLSKYNLRKDDHKLGMKVYGITYNFLKTGNVPQFVVSLVTNYHDIQRFLDIMRRHEPRTYIFEDVTPKPRSK